MNSGFSYCRIQKNMKNFLKSRSFLGLVVIAISILIGYVLLSPKPTPPALPVVMQTGGASGRAASPAPPGKGMFAWGALDQRQNSFSNMDPKKFAVRESNYGGHPAYNKAMHYLACADHFDSSKNLARDLADNNQAESSDGAATEFMLWNFARKEAECAQVTKDDLRKIDELMGTAAQAGDIKAQSYVLGRETNELIDVASARSGEDAAQETKISDAEKSLLGRATALAEKGDKEAIFLAAKLTSTDRFGQLDMTTSAAWILVGTQEKGQLFSATNPVFEDEPYAALTVEQRQVAVQQAQQLYNRCCINR